MNQTTLLPDKPASPAADWHRIENVGEVASPALLIYPDRVEANIRQMVAMVGDPTRLRPHVKTHKLPEIVRLQHAAGIHKFKCATIAEAEMVAGCGARDVLLALQPVGPNIARFLALVRKFPATRFSTIADDLANIGVISERAVAAGVRIEVLLDLDCGMHRSGITPGPAARALYAAIASRPGLTAGGLHVYDGHIHDSDLAVRKAKVAEAMQPVDAFRAELKALGLPVQRVVAGGSPTFAVHATNPAVECSPGTCLLWDMSYRDDVPDLAFQCAAVLLTRVISKPGANRLCLDLGHKAVASEKPHPRVELIGLTDATFVTHSEEHLVVETPRAAEFSVGDPLYGVPRHICPTVALHAAVTVVRGGRAMEQWKVAARDRTLTV